MPKRLADILDEFERLGKLNVRGEELRAALPETSTEGMRKARHRLQQAGRLVPVSRGSEHWLIVPLQHATAGSPPLETWLDSYLRKTLQVPYYVGLLSAAEVYGASPYAVMVTQVMVARLTKVGFRRDMDTLLRPGLPAFDVDQAASSVREAYFRHLP